MSETRLLLVLAFLATTVKGAVPGRLHSLLATPHDTDSQVVDVPEFYVNLAEDEDSQGELIKISPPYEKYWTNSSAIFVCSQQILNLSEILYPLTFSTQGIMDDADTIDVGAGGYFFNEDIHDLHRLEKRQNRRRNRRINKGKDAED